MDSIGPEQHPDAVAEFGQRLAQGLGVLATLGEAAARLAAEEMRRKERREEQAEQIRAVGTSGGPRTGWRSMRRTGAPPCTIGA